MKKLFLVFIAAGFIASCDNAADAEKRIKDSIDSVKNLQKESVDEAAKDAKENIEKASDSLKDKVDSIGDSIDKRQ